MVIDSDYILKASKRIENAKTMQELEDLRVEILGRKSHITQVLRSVSTIKDVNQRKLIGTQANRARTKLESAIQAARKELIEVEASSNRYDFDITQPGYETPKGHFHPSLEVMNELVDFFISLGFNVAEGPEVEDEWHCFEALNIPPGHPARDMQDTFYLKNGYIPRTHTSSVQIRYMEENEPPIRIISPGRVFRNEDEDATHAWAFYQLEGLVVDKSITVADMKGTLLAMVKHILGPDAQIRLRPNYFPYVEPAAEVDAGRLDNNGEVEWLELLGAGMVHDQVLRNVGIDPTVYSGFAFGLGIERLATIKYGIDDLRKLWRPDLRFVEQF